jgi:hypothetical protein
MTDLVDVLEAHFDQCLGLLSGRRWLAPLVILRVRACECQKHYAY